MSNMIFCAVFHQDNEAMQKMTSLNLALFSVAARPASKRTLRQ